MSERLAVRWADAIIADARGIQDYYKDVYSAETCFIPYGAPQLTNVQFGRLGSLSLAPRGYHLVVARLEPENNIDTIISGYRLSAARLPLVVVGAAGYRTPYEAAVLKEADRDSRIVMLGAVWDQQLLNALYAGARLYFHGHSVGGTNPSLLRAMGAGSPTAAFDVTFNREVLGGTAAAFWASPEDVAAVIANAEADASAVASSGDRARERAARLYNWDEVSDAYDGLARAIAAVRRGGGPLGRRKFGAAGVTSVRLRTDGHEGD
jgi:glycosyltransferase involved in cell wall biosynthesis